MTWSRREIGLLASALAAPQDKTVPSTAFRFEDLTPRASGPIVTRQILAGATHTGSFLDLHESELAAGQAPHPPHRHAHEELLLIRDGVLEATIAGKVTRLGPGSGAYIASNELHGWHNVGEGAARYFVL